MIAVAAGGAVDPQATGGPRAGGEDCLDGADVGLAHGHRQALDRVGVTDAADRIVGVDAALEVVDHANRGGRTHALDDPLGVVAEVAEVSQGEPIVVALLAGALAGPIGQNAATGGREALGGEAEQRGGGMGEVIEAGQAPGPARGGERRDGPGRAWPKAEATARSRRLRTEATSRSVVVGLALSISIA
ncbi:hypothetical protein [Nannocystis pusilla]|uniref:hypothetical protein n=1 Tax=Nannocystis pusilla TaxID=889268 RepID=UPI003B7EB838